MLKYDIQIPVTKFPNICRVCFIENDELQSIYEVTVENEQKTEKLDLVKIFRRYCSVEVSQNDKKPQKICKSCITLLCQSYTFFERCSWSNQVLDCILQENHSDKPAVINSDEIDSENSPNKAEQKTERKRVSKQEQTFISDSEDEPFVEDRDDDSDWEPFKEEAIDETNVKSEVLLDDGDLEKEQSSDDEVEKEPPPRKRRKNVYEPKPTAKRRGRPPKNQTQIKKDTEDLENVESQLKELECRLCKEILPDINTSIDHYDEHHAPKMEKDECILCDKPKAYKKRDNLLYHMGLHSKDSIKCIPCRKYFRSKETFTEHLQECFKVDRQAVMKIEESLEEIDSSKSENAKNVLLNTQLSQKVLKETQYDGAFSCQLCHQNLGEIDVVINHFEVDHMDDLQCIICLRTFTKHVPLFHLGLHSQKSHVCRPCRLFFRTKEEYDKHYAKYDHDKSLSCKICGKKFTRNYKKNKHMLSHLKEKNYSCNKCGKTFTYKTSLVRHFKMHFGKRFLCSSCGNAYTTKFMLQRHIGIMHTNVDADGKPLPKPPPKPIKLQCEFCGEIFTTKYGYGRHIRRHPEFKEFKCKICSFMCDNREQLDEHMEQKHNKHTCDVCGKRFPFESELKTHHRKHEDMETARFRCEICGKTARTQTQLKVHFRIHTGERPFSCEICGKSFKQTAHLKVHMFQHTGKMPFKCEICEKTFPFQHVMEIHMRTHTGEKPFQCMFCGNAYHDRTTMQKHQKKKHPDMPIQKVGRSDYKMTKLV